MIYEEQQLDDESRKMKVDFEDEVIKFKEAYANYYFKDNGKYFYVFVNDIDNASTIFAAQMGLICMKNRR